MGKQKKDDEINELKKEVKIVSFIAFITDFR